MYKLYTVKKYKTNIKGYWLDNGKVYIDNIIIKDYIYYGYFCDDKQELFDNGEQAVFYIYNGIAYIEDAKGKRTVLKHCIRYKERHLTKDYIKTLLKQHDGITIYKQYKYYTIEIWKA